MSNMGKRSSASGWSADDEHHWYHDDDQATGESDPGTDDGEPVPTPPGRRFLRLPRSRWGKALLALVLVLLLTAPTLVVIATPLPNRQGTLRVGNAAAAAAGTAGGTPTAAVPTAATPATGTPTSTTTVTSTPDPANRMAFGAQVVFAHYLWAYPLGYTAYTFTNPDDLTHWPQSANQERTWWSNALASDYNAGAAGLQLDFTLAQRAGLDAFGLLFDPAYFPTSPTLPGLRMMATIATTNAVKLIPEVWPGTAPDWAQYGIDMKTFLAAYPHAFPTYAGKPLIVLGDGVTELPFATVQPFFAAWGGVQNVYVIGDTPAGDPANIARNGWTAPLSAYGDWDVFSSYADQWFAPFVRQAQTDGKQVAWPINPDFYRVDGSSMPGATEHLGMEKINDMWQGAITHHAAFVEVETWNDFREDSAITETNLRGDSLLDLIAWYGQWYRQGALPQSTQERVFVIHHHQLVSAQTSGGMTFGDCTCHHTPRTDYIEVIALLKAPATLMLQDGSQYWSTQATAGFFDWLVYQPQPSTAPGLAVAQPDSYPTAAATRAVTSVSQIVAATPAVVVMRAGAVIGGVTSRTAIQASAAWADFSVIMTEASW